MKFVVMQIYISMCVLSTTIAQKNSIEVSLLPRVWLSQFDVQHDDFENDAMSSANRAAYGAELSYRKQLSSKFNVGLSAGYGRYSDKLIIRYSGEQMIKLHEGGKYNFLGGWNGIYQTETGYFSLSLFGGYTKHLKNSNWIGVDFGIRKLFFTNGDAPFPVNMYAGTLYRAGFEFGAIEWGYGNMGKNFAGPLLADLSITYNFMNKRNRTFFAGLTGTICPAESLNGQSVYTTIKDYKFDSFGNKHTVAEGMKYGEKVVPKYASIGLKLGMTLFRF